MKNNINKEEHKEEHKEDKKFQENIINIDILVDYREKDLISLFNQNFNTVSQSKILKYINTNYKNKHQITETHINYNIVNLDVGDINIKINDKLIYIIERKAVNDLISSIKTSRYQEQKIRIKSTKVPALYIIEGNINYNNSNDSINGLKITQLQGVFTSLLLKDNIPYLMTKSIQDTYDYLIYIIKKVLSLYYKKDINENNENINNINNNEYSKTIKMRKKDNMDQKTCFIAQLMLIPGISHNIAQEITKHYKSWFDLCLSYLGCEEEKRINLLASIPISLSCNKTRRIGRVLSQVIFNTIFRN